jgi:hypothetical protein
MPSRTCTTRPERAFDKSTLVVWLPPSSMSRTVGEWRGIFEGDNKPPTGREKADREKRKKASPCHALTFDCVLPASAMLIITAVVVRQRRLSCIPNPLPISLFVPWSDVSWLFSSEACLNVVCHTTHMYLSMYRERAAFQAVFRVNPEKASCHITYRQRTGELSNLAKTKMLPGSDSPAILESPDKSMT